MTFGPKYSTHKMEAFPQRDTHKSGKFSKVIEWNKTLKNISVAKDNRVQNK